MFYKKVRMQIGKQRAVINSGFGVNYKGFF